MPLTLIVYSAVAASAFGIAYWAYRARDDRSAFVGLYLLFGIPAGLLAVSGLALLISGNGLGPLFLLLGLGLGLPLLKPFRRLVASVTPMDSASPVDMTGLCLLLTTLAFLLFSVSVSGDPPDKIGSVGLIDIILQAGIELVLAYAAVGWWFVRNTREATARLGITRPTWRMVGAIFGSLVIAFIIVSIAGVAAQVFQPERVAELDNLTQEITAEVQNPLGAVVLGASAGIGEEAIFRGALQPRFGIFLTSLLFALIHAPQYGLTYAVAGLFGVSVVLGLERRYFGTTAAMATHALFNFLVVLAQIYA